MESLATLDFSLGNYIVNCTGENCSDVKFLNLTDSEVQEYIVQKLGHRRKDLFSSFSLTCIYVVIFITGVVGNLSTCFITASAIITKIAFSRWSRSMLKQSGVLQKGLHTFILQKNNE
jgi:hypothetical protein